MLRSLVGSEMCIRDRIYTVTHIVDGGVVHKRDHPPLAGFGYTCGLVLGYSRLIEEATTTTARYGRLTAGLHPTGTIGTTNRPGHLLLHHLFVLTLSLIHI
eukprot:TRINITY_DN5488_c0_g1_i1.p1 TRINITY_DN5488_c0_g1~~TRINITY_DN5488_c0_g1_i1.p1  ORF type:complete len:101 (+),score=11.92 TRINITY_DN5488_c0_g1_i1:148-450(+)